jgi:anthranilate/para-aminobenzoate synthase component II
MLGGRDLAGRALDQGGKVLAREPADLDAPTLGLCVELRSVGESCGRRVEETKQAMRCTVVDVDSSKGGHHAALVSPVQVTAISG